LLFDRAVAARRMRVNCRVVSVSAVSVGNRSIELAP
jgi:hypothetical protein